MKETILPGNLTSLLTKYGLKLGDTLQTLCIAIAHKARPEGGNSVLINIHPDLLAPSYRLIPAMFGRSLTVKLSEYPSVHSYWRNGMLRLRLSHQRVPTTFKARVLAALMKKQQFEIRKSKVPESYRIRPSLLSSVLSMSLGRKVCNHCKDDKMIWKVK